MSKTWVIADPHFGHANILNFCNTDGSKLRPWTDVNEMDSAICYNWNSLVNPEDRVYVLGDLVINKKHIPTIARCNGRKVLVKGNHDIYKLKDYTPYFDDIRAYVTSPHQYILSHIPVHPSSLGRWKINIHGHLHGNVVRDHNEQPDKRYVCVSVEQTHFMPVLLDDILKEYNVN